MNNTRKIASKFIIGVLAGFIFCGICTVVVAVPRVFHQQWLKLGSPYDVEDEYLYVNILRHVREVLYESHVNPDGLISKTIENWQKREIDKALAKIPSTDGERVIWQLWSEEEFLYKLKTAQDVPAEMPVALHYFDQLTTLPMASKWARERVRFEFADTFATFLLRNYKKSQMTNEELDNSFWKVTRKMEELAPEINTKEFYLSSHDYEIIEPLVWNYAIMLGASRLSYNSSSDIYSCNKEALKILQSSRARSVDLLKSYTPYSLNQVQGKHFTEFAAKTFAGVSRNIDHDSLSLESAIYSHCPNLS